LNWNRPEESLLDQDAAYKFDYVIGSDVLFMGWCAKPVAQVATRYLDQNGVIIIVDPYRLQDEAFLNELDSLGVSHQKTYDFPPALIERLVAPMLDPNGSVVPVKCAKLLMASRNRIDENINSSLLELGLIPLRGAQ
jgi:hypothetical protein